MDLERLSAPVKPDDEPDSVRKAELAAKLLSYAAEHGLSDVSLRPLAAAVGSSPRVLLYFFGSKEGIIREVLGRTRVNQQILTRAWVEELPDPAERIGRLWTWLSDPANAGVERLFMESYARSLHDEDGPWRDFGADSIADWLPVIEGLLISGTGRRSSKRTRALASYVLAGLRGFLLDLLATGDNSRIDAGMAVLQDHVRSVLNA